MRYQWKDLSSLILLITILISLNGKFNVSRKNKYAWVHKRTKQTVKELMKADSPINNPWVKERRNKKKNVLRYCKQHHNSGCQDGRAVYGVRLKVMIYLPIKQWERAFWSPNGGVGSNPTPDIVFFAYFSDVIIKPK